MTSELTVVLGMSDHSLGPQTDPRRQILIAGQMSWTESSNTRGPVLIDVRQGNRGHGQQIHPPGTFGFSLGSKDETNPVVVDVERIAPIFYFWRRGHSKAIHVDHPFGNLVLNMPVVIECRIFEHTPTFAIFTEKSVGSFQP